MKGLRAFAFLLLALLGVVTAPAAQAAISCTNFSTPGASINYTNGTTTYVQTYFQVTCTRAAGDPTSITYSVKTTDNGQNANGVNNKAINGSALLGYDLYVPGGGSCTSAGQWKGNTTISDKITWSSTADTTSITRNTPYWVCINSAQTATNSGQYQDTVNMSLSYPGGTTLPATAQIFIYAPATCTFTSQPGNITISGYVPFTSPQMSGFTTFAVSCTNLMPYTLATDVAEGVAAGVRYILSLSATSARGTGAPQTYTVSATVPGGQAGGTGPQTQSHYVTVSY